MNAFHMLPKLFLMLYIHCCAPGLGKMEVVGTPLMSKPPNVPCCECCHPCPVCWFTNCDCRKGFVLPVTFTGSGALGGGLKLDLAKGFVPVLCAWRGCCWIGESD